jgi:hypothetical protein
MAIGSAPEAGVTFARWGDMTDDDRFAWFVYMTNRWGPNLVGGYATLIDVRTYGLLEAMNEYAKVFDTMEASAD